MIEVFLQNAYAQNYYIPNRIISKSERPKWRFHVKAYIKIPQSVPREGEGGKTAAELLEKLFGSNLKEYFIREYEAEVKKGILPREQLQKTYNDTVEKGELPHHFW